MWIVDPLPFRLFLLLPSLLLADAKFLWSRFDCLKNQGTRRVSPNLSFSINLTLPSLHPSIHIASHLLIFLLFAPPLSVLSPLYNRYFAQPVVGYFHQNCLLSSAHVRHQVDFNTISCKELQHFEIPFSFVIERTGKKGRERPSTITMLMTIITDLLPPFSSPLYLLYTYTAIMHGLGCWFDIDFKGSTSTVVLSTSPGTPGTHWYQCRLLLAEPLAVNRGQTVSGVLKFAANESFSYDLELTGTYVGR